MRRLALLLLAACEQPVPKPTPTPITPTPPTPVVPTPPVDAPAPTTAARMRAKELFDRPDLMDKEVDLDLYETVRDENWSSIANPGELDIEVEDVGANRLEIAWADHKPLAMKDVEIPARVHATLRQGRLGLRLEATQIVHFPFPPPVKIDKPSDILGDPKLSGRLVTFEADWLVGFEASYVDRGIWMNGMPDTKETCKPPPPKEDQIYSGRTFRVRVVGIAYNSGQYGHLGGGKGLIVAREITYLDPKRPQCK